MNKWQETVKRISKLHPGKSLKTILPLAKVEYKKMGHSSSTKKVEKLSKPSRARKSTRGIRKGRKGRKPKKMKGGGHCHLTQENLISQQPTSDHYERLTGGSHCNTAKGHEKKRKPRKSKRRPRKPKKMKGGQCSDSCSGCPS